MNIEDLCKKFDIIDKSLKKENNNLKDLSKKLADLSNDETAKNTYYSFLNKYEKDYQIRNDEYKRLISNYSKAYLEMSDFYVGDNLPRETYLDSKKDTYELFTLFILFALWEPYINAYYDKYCV